MRITTVAVNCIRASRPATSQPIVTCAATAYRVHTYLSGYLPNNHSITDLAFHGCAALRPTAASNTQLVSSGLGLPSTAKQAKRSTAKTKLPGFPRQKGDLLHFQRAPFPIRSFPRIALSAFSGSLALAAPVRLARALMLRPGLAFSSAHPSAHLRPTSSLVDRPEARAPSAFSSHTPCPVSPCPSISRLSYRQHSSVLPFLPPLFPPGLRRCVGSWTAQAKTTLISPRAPPRDEDLQRNLPVRTASTSTSTSTAAPTASMVGLTPNLSRANAAPRV